MAKHQTDEHDTLHHQARTLLENAIRRCVHKGIPPEVVMRELVDLLARVSIENATPLSESVAAFIDSYEDEMLALTPLIAVELEPKVPTDAN